VPSVFSVAGATVLYFSGIETFYTLITLTVCIFVSSTLFLEFFNGTKTRHAVFKERYPIAFWNLIAKNKRRYGGHIIHFGVVLLFMAFSANAFNTEKQVTLRPGESVNIKKYSLRYDGLAEYPTANRHKVVATLTLFNDHHNVGVLSPEKSLYTGQNQPTTEVAIHTTVQEDLYVILAGNDTDSATFKILVNPLVVWIWIGGSVMAFGTLIVMLPNRRRRGKITFKVKLAEAI
jgi:cytochrome c-type biogenesis protein CcmF